MLSRALGPLTAVTSWLGWIIDITVCLMLAAIVSIGGLEVAARNLFNHSFVWAHEVTILLANWVYFLGICIVYQHRGDITVTFFLDKLSPSLRRAWVILCHLISAALFAVIVWYGWELIKLQAPFHTTGLRIPNPAFSAPVVIGAVVLTLLTLRHALAEFVGEAPAQPSAATV